MKLIILLLLVIWYDSCSFGHMHIDIAKNIHFMSKRSNKLSKRQDDLGYLEQCSILQFWDKQIGRVNVLAFFDSSWKFSHRQAAMLRVLRERFEKTGFDNIQFFAINAAPGEGQFVDPLEVEIEEETWRKISPSEAGGSPPVMVSAEALIEALGPEIYFIQDTDQMQIWLKLRAYRDQILVIDRCGRLTYQVIVPWSILHFPYVKAAILSTYKDEPCGYCQFQENPFETRRTDVYNEPETSTIAIKDLNENSTNTLNKVETSTVSYNEALPERSTTIIIETDQNNVTSSPEALSTIVDVQTENYTDSTSETSEEPVTLDFQSETSEYLLEPEEDTTDNQTEVNNVTSIEDESLTMNTETDIVNNATSVEDDPATGYTESEINSANSVEAEASTMDAETEINTVPSVEDETSTMNTEPEIYNATSGEFEPSTVNAETEISPTSAEDELSIMYAEINNSTSEEVKSKVEPEINYETSVQDESSTTNTEPEIDNVTSAEDESTLNTQTEINNVTSMERELSTLNTQTEISSLNSTENQSSIMNTQTESNDSTFMEDVWATLNEPTENFDMSEETKTLIDQTENATFYTSPNFDSSTETDFNESSFFNTTGNDDSEENSNLTTLGDFEATREVTEEITNQPSTDSIMKKIFNITDKLDIDNVTKDVLDFTDKPYIDNVTENITGTALPTTVDVSNSTAKSSEPRLKETGDIENIDSRDVLKSRLTNARSVSASGGSVNKLDDDEEMYGEMSKEQSSSTEPDFVVPIRIIMRAPHVDEYSDRSMKSHEYLVLKTGEPDYHEHLESRENDSSNNSSQIVENGDQQSKPEGTPRNKSEAVKRTFGKDESPGLYGEVADYWRNFGKDQLGDNSFLTNADDEDEEERVLEQEESFSEDTVLKSTVGSLTEKVDVEEQSENPKNADTGEENEKVYDYNTDTNNEEMDLVDEEAKSKLIAHYSKLLPWLYYVLAK